MTLKERYKKLLVFKHPDVEEIVDLLVHRPAAAWFASLIYNLPISPNHVTYMSLAAGWAGSLVYYDAAIGHRFFDTTGYIIAAALYFVSVVLDCADGQIARAKGGGTRMGRIVDGIVDALVVISLYVVMGFDIKHRFGDLWFYITALAGFNAWVQIAIYDKIKIAYLSRTSPSKADGNESTEEIEAAWQETKSSGTLAEKIGMFIYAKLLLKAQSFLAPGENTVDPSELRPANIQHFRRRFADPMRIASFLGLGTHMMFIYSAIFLAAFWPPALLGVQFIFLSTFNFLLIYALWSHHRMQKYSSSEK